MSIFEAVLTQAAHRERKQSAQRAQFEQSKAAELQDLVKSLHMQEVNDTECNILLSDLAEESGMAMWSLNKYAKHGVIAAEKKKDPEAFCRLRWYISQETYDRCLFRIQNGIKLTSDLN